MKHLAASVLLLLALGGIGGAQENKMSAEELLAGADARIARIRMEDLIVRVVGPDGRPVPGVRVRAEQTHSAGEARQADYVEKLYTLLFSHPAVEAITWWDFMDGAWQGAPAGLVRKDLTPKPVYQRLMALIKGKWWTRTEVQTDGKGECRLRGFRGDYRVTVITPKGYKSFEKHLKRGENLWVLTIGGP